LNESGAGMQHRRRFPLWIIPVLGIIFGVIYAYMFIHGLVVTWHFVGKPSENIARIIGIVGGHNLFVETETGNFYSIEYYNYVNGNDVLPLPIEWKKELNSNIQPDPQRTPNMKFVSYPLLYKVKQIYEMQYPRTEGEFLVKFALSEDGNLWMWNYGQGGMAVITYFIFPVIGFVGGGILALFIRLIVFVQAKVRK
jgi:hypothetical protein